MSQHVFAWGERPTSPTPEANLPSNWVPDEERTSCLTCGEAFTLFLRKHHCRKCGEIFCHKCSSRRIPLPEISESAIPGRMKSCFISSVQNERSIRFNHNKLCLFFSARVRRLLFGKIDRRRPAAPCVNTRH